MSCQESPTWINDRLFKHDEKSVGLAGEWRVLPIKHQIANRITTCTDMALGATIFKADLQIADLDRNYYHDHALTLARHPSETDERMMVRLLAFALHAHETLLFGNGLSTRDEPALWQKDLTGAIESWIDVGLPDEKLIRRACGRARRVFVYTYGGRVADMWWNQWHGKFDGIKNLTVTNLPLEASRAIARQTRRNMRLNCTIQDRQVWLADGNESALIELITLKSPPSV